jgi:hypothetical protein
MNLTQEGIRGLICGPPANDAVRSGHRESSMCYPKENNMRAPKNSGE